MALFTALDAAGQAAVAARFHLGEILRVDPLWAGTINSNFRFATTRGTFFVRLAEGASAADIAYEAALVKHLADRGVPAPRPVDPDGDDLVAGHRFMVFPWVAGEHRDPGAAECHALGRALAAMHLGGVGFPLRRASRYEFPRIVERWRAVAARADLSPRVEVALTEVAGETAWLEARAAARRALPAGVIHGDLFPDNVLFDTGDDGGPRVAALIDFEQASDGTFAYDLAVCLASWCWDGAAFNPARTRALVAGYGEVRSVAPAERDGLYIEARAAAMRFTVTRITDVELNPGASAETRKVKDFGEYLARLRWLRGLGADGFVTLAANP